jgi:phage/plasmid-associated DNA primase
MDTLAGFVEECCERGETYADQGGHLYTASKAWTERNGEHVVTRQAFGRQLTEREFPVMHQRLGKLRMGLRALDVKDLVTDCDLYLGGHKWSQGQYRSQASVAARRERREEVRADLTTIAAKGPKGGGPYLSRTVAEKIIALAEAGLTYPEIERAAVISKGAICYWIRAGSGGLPGYQGFRRRFYLARAPGYARKRGGPPDPPATGG